MNNYRLARCCGTCKHTFNEEFSGELYLTCFKKGLVEICHVCDLYEGPAENSNLPAEQE